MKTRGLLLIVVCTMCLSISEVRAQRELNVIRDSPTPWLEYTDAPNALYHHFAKEAFAHLAKRAEVLSAITSQDEWNKRQEQIRSTLQKVVGPFPARTPLNARVVRQIDKDAYRIEHIIFESQPGFYVTSSLFVPKGLKRREKRPAVIYCSGHTPLGYRSPAYQQVILNLVQKGFIVLAFDPVGQGERMEYYDADTKKSTVGGPTAEHSYPGSQAFITGSSQARYMIWDGIRAVDYLLTRREVDAARIGITGRSGGGTQSAYIAAFDDRIVAAAPECYITSFTRLLQSIGPQDAEQNFMHGISEGLDHGDLLIVRAPRPGLMITTTRDIFNIQGARETAREVGRAYQALGAPGSFGMVEDDAPHESTKKNREALYAFLQKHLHLPGVSTDESVEQLTADELRVTETGQVSTSLKGETVFTLNRKEALQKTGTLERSRANENHLAIIPSQAQDLSGYRKPSGETTPVFAGRIQRDGYAIEKYFLKGEGDYVVPYLLMVPGQPNGQAILYLHPSGKNAEASENGEISFLAQSGFTVLAPDLPGIGELGSGDFRGDAFIGGVSHNIWYSAILIGRSIVGVQAGDVARLLQALRTHHRVETVFGIARRELTPLMLHVANFLPEIQRVALIDALPSYRSLVINKTYPSTFIPGAVAGALAAYDLPDLAAALAPRRLLIAQAPEDQELKEVTQSEYEFVRSVYEDRGSKNELTIYEGSKEEDLRKIIAEWIN